MNKYQEALDNIDKCRVNKTLNIDIKDILILQELVDQQSILEEYNVTPEILREVLLTGQMFRNQPTLLECIKEWNEKGFDVDVYALEINIHNYSTVDKEEHGIEFSIDLEKKTLFIEGEYNSFPYDVVHLLSKTLKALEVKDDK